MKKVYIFGAGGTGAQIAERLEDAEILGVLDNDSQKWGSFCFFDVLYQVKEEVKRERTEQKGYKKCLMLKKQEP